jgi:hypothetical protein
VRTDGAVTGEEAGSLFLAAVMALGGALVIAWSGAAGTGTGSCFLPGAEAAGKGCWEAGTTGFSDSCFIAEVCVARGRGAGAWTACVFAGGAVGVLFASGCDAIEGAATGALCRGFETGTFATSFSGSDFFSTEAEGIDAGLEEVVCVLSIVGFAMAMLDGTTFGSGSRAS